MKIRRAREYSRELWLGAMALALLLLAGCAAMPSADDNPNAGRYSILQDRAPSGIVDLALIPEVNPEPVRRTKAGNRSPYTILGRTYHVLPSESGYREQGVASWYGEKFHGHDTSNGEVFDMYKLSAAHKTLPIPSFLRVTNLGNDRSIIVRVNDRGPFHDDRVVDLSYAAALKLGFADTGTADVLIESVVDDSAGDQTHAYAAAEAQPRPGESAAQQYLQVGAFANLESAQQLRTRMQALTAHHVFIRSISTPTRGLLHRVRIGPIQDAGEIRQLAQSVVAANLGSPYTVLE